MFIPQDRLTTLFHDDNYKFHINWLDHLRHFLVWIALMIGIVVFIIIYSYIETEASSTSKWIIRIAIFVECLAIFAIVETIYGLLQPANYTIALDEKAHYIVITSVAQTHIGRVVKEFRPDLHKIKKMDIQQYKDYVLIRIHLDDGKTLKLEIPDEKTANHIRDEIRRILNSGQEPSEEIRKAYDVKVNAVVKILPQDDPLAK